MIETHRKVAMRGRDPEDPSRSATPLELLYDLTFVIAFSVAAGEFAHYAAEGHFGGAIAAFAFCLFAVCWAWINFTWFASAFDTDDWPYRIAVMVQMIGVLILSLGIPELFKSVIEGPTMNGGALLAGYIIMRVPLIAQWLRAAVQDPTRRRLCITYAVGVALAQVGWTVTTFLHLPVEAALLSTVPMIVVELSVPMFAERRDGGTPWHPHHVAERYGLLTIIVLGEVLLGVVTSLGVVVNESGWTVDVAVMAIGGVGLMFGMWWLYFMYPAGQLLHRNRDLAFRWGFGHIPLFGAIALVGAGMHVGALYVEDHAEITKVAVMWSVAIPLILFFIVLILVYLPMIENRRVAVGMTIVKIWIALMSVLWAAAGLRLAFCVLWLSLAPIVSVLVNERSAEVPKGMRGRPIS